MAWRSRTGVVPIRELRLFRRHPGLRFDGVVHADLTASVRDLLDGGWWRIVPSALRIDHDGYDGDIFAKQSTRLPLLESRTITDPDHVYSWLDRSRVHQATGDLLDAAEALTAALEACRRTVHPKPGDVLVYCRWLRLHRRHRCHQAPLGADTPPPTTAEQALLDEAIGRFGLAPGLRFFRAQQAIDSGSPEHAVADLEWLAAVDLTSYVDPAVGWPEALFSVVAPEMLATCPPGQV